MEEIEKLFYRLDKQTEEISQQQNISYLEAVIEVLKLSDGDYNEIIDHYNRNVRRKVYQYLMLKALKDTTQSQHQMTPDGIGYIIAFFIQILMKQKKSTKILELGLGTANLLATISEIISEDNLVLSGVEIDPLYIELSALLADYLELPLNLLHQDALAPIFIDKQDIVIADVPVGYYPNDEIAGHYQLSSKEGHSFSHYLFIEQSITLLNEGGYAIMLLPQKFLEESQAEELRKYIAKKTKLRAILNLPSTIFNSQQVQRSIVILEKPLVHDLHKPEVILATVPSLKNMKAIKEFFISIEQSLAIK